MYKKSLVLVILLFNSHVFFCQKESQSIEDKVKIKRDSILINISNKENQNIVEINRLTEELKDLKGNYKKIEALKYLQNAFEKRLVLLEEKPKTKIRLNGQLALLELLSIQRDIKPAKLFLHTQSFYKGLGDISNVQNYPFFNQWKKEYRKWYSKNKGSEEIYTIINNSIKMISDTSNKIPVFGSVVQTITSGLSSIIERFGRREKKLKKLTPKFITLLNTISLFEQQKSIIDYEWKSIEKELNELNVENKKLLNSQLNYYGLEKSDFVANYMNTTLDKKRDQFKKKCIMMINDKVKSAELKKDKSWLGEIETYMYKVQAIRIRFGELTYKMQENLNRYNELIDTYNTNIFPVEFKNKLVNLRSSLNQVRKTFNDSFKPQTYIEDSSTMYINSDK